MSYSDLLITLADTTGMESPTLFPFSLNLHAGFVCIATIFFIRRFARQKQPFQLIFAIAIPLSMVIWFIENRTFYYGLGIIEAVLILAALVTAIACGKKKPKTSPDDNEASDANVSADENSAEKDDDK